MVNTDSGHRERSSAATWSRVHVRLGAGDEEAAGAVQRVQALEVEVAAIHHVEGARLRDEQIEDTDVMQFVIQDVDERRDRAAQVEQGVQLHRYLGGAKWRPGEHRQAQADCGGIQRVDRVGQLHPEAVFGVERPCPCD